MCRSQSTKPAFPKVMNISAYVSSLYFIFFASFMCPVTRVEVFNSNQRLYSSLTLRLSGRLKLAAFVESQDQSARGPTEDFLSSSE